MSDTIVKPKKVSAWNRALQEFNLNRPPGSKFIMPKKDTEEYLKVKEIAEKFKREAPVLIETVSVTPKKPRTKRVKPTITTTVVEEVAPTIVKKKVTRKKKEGGSAPPRLKGEEGGSVETQSE